MNQNLFNNKIVNRINNSVKIDQINQGYNKKQGRKQIF